MSHQYDAAIIGAGISGMSTAALLQSKGLSTVVIEQHQQIGGCAGYYQQDGFTFDVGATTLVDFHSEGIGGQLLDELDFESPSIKIQKAYQVWLPDQTVTLHRDQQRWREELKREFGDSENHLQFYQFIEEASTTLWRIVRSGVKMPIQGIRDVIENVKSVGIWDIPLIRYLRWTMKDAMVKFSVYDDISLRKMFAMLVEDTVHSTIEKAPLLNALLGITIRRVGIGRAEGGMYGFWDSFKQQYLEIGGTVETGRTVKEAVGSKGDYRLTTSGDTYQADQVISTVPVNLTKQIAPSIVGSRLDNHIQQLRRHEGGAAVVFLGVPEETVADRDITHHQVLQEYYEPLGNGNNMFISVSEPEDMISAPKGYRAVILSTHCELPPWQNLDENVYEEKKEAIGKRLVKGAHAVYPDLATDPAVFEVGTPKTYETFTNRPRGAIGGYRQNLKNTNQNAVPQDIGIDGFYLAGDTTWPGLGTVACVKGSFNAANNILN